MLYGKPHAQQNIAGYDIILYYILLIVLVLVITLFVYRESTGYNIVEYTVFTDKDIGSPVRFAMLSDLHETDVTHDMNERLIASVRSLGPDFIVLAGDMVTSHKEPFHDPEAAYSFIEKLAKSYRVYYGLGNHEQRFIEEPRKYQGKKEEFTARTQASGATILSDDHADLEGRNIRIYGYNIPLKNYRRGTFAKLPDGIIEKTLGGCDDRFFNILIAHSPDHFEEYVKFAPDLVLSGHLHGGIVALPGIGGIISPQLRPFPRYDHGEFKEGGTTMIVSRGIGWHSIPIRIFNKAEIVSVTIRKKEV